MKKVCFILVLLFIFSTLQAHRLPFEQLWLIVENYLYSEFDEELNLEDIHSQIEHCYYNPIEWNGATKEELDALYIIGDEAVEELLFYAYTNKPIHTIEELLLVDNLHPALLLILPELLYVDENELLKPLKERFKDGSHLLKLNSTITAEKRAGFINHKYAGIPASINAKYRYSASNLFDIGVALQSDAGDSWRHGFDLYRLFGQIKNIGIVKNLTLGSYKAGFGEGLIFGQMSFGSSANKLITNNLTTNGVHGYGGTQESPTLNGVSITLGNSHIKGSLLYSYTPLDGDTTGHIWSSYTTTGYHRTATEIERKNSFGLHTSGANFIYDRHKWRIGATAYFGHFTLPAVKPNGTWNAHHFEGQNQFATSLNYGVNLSPFAFWGESAVSCNKAIGYATTNNIRLNFENQIILTLNHRYFSPDYYAFWANSYSSRSEIRSEHGASLAMQIPIKGNMHITAFADVFKPLYPTTTLPSKPSYELMVEYDALVNGVNICAKIRYRQKAIFDNSEKSPAESFYHIASAQIKAIYSYNSLIFTTSAFVNHSRQWGIMLHQDVIYAPKTIPLKITSRIALFSAKDYYTRFFLYEQNILEQSYSPALYGEGLRWYLSAQYKFNFGLTIAARVAQFLYFDKETISSGNNKINSNHQTDFALAMTYRIK